MTETDLKELKKGGMTHQTEAGLFSVRLHVVGGRLGTEQLRLLREAADRFGRGEVHLTSRQGVEIHNVPRGSLAALKEYLAASGAEVGVCGPAVRTVTACPGCRVCARGVIDSPALAGAIDREFYGKPAPHKFKVGVTGCANNCIKAEENDAGIKGRIEPRWEEKPACDRCGACRAACPARAIGISKEGGLTIDRSACIGCGDCIASCPAGCMVELRRGFAVFAGGKFGRLPILGKRLPGILETEAEATAAVGAVLGFFRLHGKPRERFGNTLERTGFSPLEDYVKEIVGAETGRAMQASIDHGKRGQHDPERLPEKDGGRFT